MASGWARVKETLKRHFVDLRSVSILMCVWLSIVVSILAELGMFSNPQFVAFGPRPELKFMHMAIDNYYKYNLLIVLIIVHTFITDIIADSLSPHVLNVVQDTKNLYIPHRPATYITITTIWAIYCSISMLFVVFIAFSQLDLLMVRLFSDIFANFVTTNMYLHGKTHDPEMYQRIMDSRPPAEDDSSGCEGHRMLPVASSSASAAAAPG